MTIVLRPYYSVTMAIDHVTLPVRDYEELIGGRPGAG